MEPDDPQIDDAPREPIDLDMAKAARAELMEEDPEMKEFFEHPLNAMEVTPEMMEQDTYRALQDLAYSGTPDEIAGRFATHGVGQLKKIADQHLEGESAATCQRKALEFFDKASEQKPTGEDVCYKIIVGRIRANLGLKNYGKVKDLVREGLKIKETTELHMYGADSRFKLEKWAECIDFCKAALKLDPSFEPGKRLMGIALAQ
jgi:hypothetical protein